SQVNVAVDATADGGFFVAWQTNSGGAAGLDIRGRLFDAQGNALSAENPLNTEPLDDQFDPDVLTLPDGRILVTWAAEELRSEILGAQGYQVRGRLLTPDGNPLGPDFNVSLGTRFTYSDVNIKSAALEDGTVVVAWSSESDNTADDTS